MTNSLPWFFDGPNRNRWFTELKNGDFPWQTVSHNQMVPLYFIGNPQIKWMDENGGSPILGKPPINVIYMQYIWGCMQYDVMRKWDKNYHDLISQSLVRV